MTSAETYIALVFAAGALAALVAVAWTVYLAQRGGR
jgi:hypothetical protein